MASREASLKVTLQPASFQAGLRRMGNMTTTAGKQMGAALKGPMVAGLKSARSEVAGMVNGLKSGIKIAASLGGALSFGAMAKDALTLQNTYRNIAFNVNKVATNAQTWESIQKMITGAVMDTGRTADELTDAFTKIFEATGDFDYAVKAVKLVGTTATATGESTDDLANVMQMAYRKFGTGMDDAEEAMARFVGLTGIGGAGLGDMTGKFALMAGEAANAGMTGTEGISQMLGMLQLLDSSIGEKAVPGLKMMFQAVKGGSTQFLQLEKAMKGSGVAFDPDMSAMDKILATLQSAKGTAAGKMVFTADARVVYDELAKPFDEAMKKSLAAGFSKKEAMDAGIAAFNKNLEDAAQSSLEYADLMGEAAERSKTDPLIKMNKAMARLAEAFSQPKMIGAMNKLADKLPAMADAVADVISYILDNPWESLAMVVGGKLALAFGGSVVKAAIAQGMTSLFARMAAVQTASMAASVATSGATSLGVGGAVAGAGGAGAVAATAATAAAALLAAGAVGVGAGLGINEITDIEGQMGAESTSLRRAQGSVVGAQNALRGGDSQKMQGALLSLSSAKTDMEYDTIGGGYGVLDSLASLVTGNKSQSEMRAGTGKQIDIEEAKLKKALDDLRANTTRAATAIGKLAAVSTSRGTMTPAPATPGADPTGG